MKITQTLNFILESLIRNWRENWVGMLIGTRSTFWVTLLLMKKKVFLSFYAWAKKFSNKTRLTRYLNSIFLSLVDCSVSQQILRKSIWALLSCTVFIRFAYGAGKSLYCARMHICDNSVGTSCVTITQNNPFASQSQCDRLSYKGWVVFPSHKNPFDVDGYYFL